MVVSHNLQAMNANRILHVNTGGLSKTSEKLSSGYRINRAADDAAGLAISEKMRAQIRGLDRASLNAQDGISVVQTAEGALNEVHSMLQRMNELCVQAANDTNTDADRHQLQLEIDQLKNEIDDVSEKTTFNTKKILMGKNTYDASGAAGANLPGEEGTLTYHTAKKALNGVFLSGANIKDVDVDTGIMSFGIDSGHSMDGYAFGLDSSIPGVTPEMEAKGANTKADYAAFNYKAPNGTTKNMSVIFSTSPVTAGQPYCSYDELIDAMKNFEKETGFAYGWENYLRGFDGIEKAIYKDYGSEISHMSIRNATATSRELYVETWSDVNDPLEIKLQVGSLSGQSIDLKLSHMNARGLGITGARVDDFESAGKAMKSIQDAIDMVSSERAKLGAQQNRLEHTILNLDNTSENTQAAESRIRDTDMAAMMVLYTRHNVLAQTGQSILAQANQSTSGVLALLG